MTLKIYQIDAFANKIFGGNPAAVCPLDHWIDEEVMQLIAMENNLAETVFYVKGQDQYQIRWFTPTIEVDLCGHATLAAAYVIFHIEHYHQDVIQFFSSRSGILPVTKKGDWISLDFPTDIYDEVEITEAMHAAFDISPKSVFKGKSDYMFVYESEKDIIAFQPNMDKIAAIEARGIIITAPGVEVDFVSRFFAPQSGITEDPVTGSAHTTLIPYWASVLGKNQLTARQLSRRKGDLHCQYLGDRVVISGQGKIYLSGEIYIG
ncbi:MAG: PhzF family phenazine biosynthesis protein [Saprospiraceae bacterium]